MVFENPSNLLGAMPNMPFEEHTLPVEPGDMLFAYTDGLTDRRNEKGEFYSIDRVARLLEGSEQGDLGVLYDAICKDVQSFSATDELRDDIAFVVSRFH
jgi:sigma-B regulation protein RsbU (phosphoserine phosphatase)